MFLGLTEGRSAFRDVHCLGLVCVGFVFLSASTRTRVVWAEVGLLCSVPGEKKLVRERLESLGTSIYEPT